MDSVTQYIEGLKQGQEHAAQKIFERFLHRLIAQAHQKLKSAPRKAADEDDVVQVAFAQFFRQVQQGRFAKLDDRDDLWQILAMLVDRRAKDQIRRQNTAKAGGGKVWTESVFLSPVDASHQPGLEAIAGIQPTPELSAELAELFRMRLALLDPESQQLAILKMQGYTNQETAEQLQISLRSVERRLERIRAKWSQERPDD